MRTRTHQQVHGQFYTGAAYGALLVDRLHDEAVDLAVELGVGNGALLSAVTGRWPRARCISVDIDPLHQYTQYVRDSHSHYCMDALDLGLLGAIGLEQVAADVAVCNPPFVTPHWRPAFADILRRAGLPLPINAARIGADVLFLAQNLWMLRKQGQLGIIVPDGIISGAKSRPIREALIAQHGIREVIELPKKAFKGIEVRTFILNICKDHQSTKHIRLLRCDEEGNLEPSITVTLEEATNRMDYSFYSWKQSSLIAPEEPSFNSKIQVIRGNVSTALAKENLWRVLHTTDITPFSNREDFVIPSDITFQPNKVCAQPGDVLVARVGRNLEGKIVKISSGTAIISDCLYAIRSKYVSPEAIFRALNSESGQAWIKAHTHGTCAQFITKADLSRFPF